MKRRPVVVLAPSYYRYRVPVFDALSSALEHRLVIVSQRHQPSSNAEEAQTQGTFKRRFVRSLGFMLSRHHEAGAETPRGMLISPGLATVLFRLRPSVVISSNFNAWTLTSIMAGFRTVVFWEGTAHTERTVGRARMRLRRWIARRAAGFVVNGRLSRQYLESQLGVSSERVTEGGLGPELAPAGAREAVTTRPIVAGSVRFLFVGRLTERKGVLALVRAFAMLLGDSDLRHRFRLTIVGGGALNSEVQNLAKELGVSDLVAMAGAVHPSRVWEYYASHDVFVLPTLQDNWPLVVPEAMSMGMPVLLSNRAGSAPDLIVEGVTGFTFNPDRPEQLAALAAKYVRDPSLIERHGRAGIEVARGYEPVMVAARFADAVTAIEAGDAR